jgi:hypothetical protein
MKWPLARAQLNAIELSEPLVSKIPCRPGGAKPLPLHGVVKGTFETHFKFEYILITLKYSKYPSKCCICALLIVKDGGFWLEML